MQFMMYGTRPSKDKSGAYLFLPDGKAKVFPERRRLRCFPCSSEASCVCCCITPGSSGQTRRLLLHLFGVFLMLQSRNGACFCHIFLPFMNLSPPSP